MNKRNKLTLIIGVAIILFISLVWLKLHFSLKYEIGYCNDQILFEGDYQEICSLEYNRIHIQIFPKYGIGDDAISQCRIYDIKNFKVYINDLSFKVKDLTPEIMVEVGGQKIESTSDSSTWKITSSLGRNPPYRIICIFNNNRISSLHFGIRNPKDPAMGPEQICPISFSFDGSQKKIKLPISKKKLTEVFGTPDSVRRKLKWP